MYLNHSGKADWRSSPLGPWSRWSLGTVLELSWKQHQLKPCMVLLSVSEKVCKTGKNLPGQIEIVLTILVRNNAKDKNSQLTFYSQT